MDNFIDKPWVIRIMSMALAILLFVSVNGLTNKETGTTPNGMENADTETIADVPVDIYYDSENLVVSGVPKSVDVKIEGQRRFVEAAKRQRDFSVYVDLSEVELGKQRVPILYKDLSEKLKVQIEPSYVDISLQEKVTAEFKVDVEYNRNILAEGFEAERPEVEPKTVKITGAKDIVEKVTYVKATIDASGLVTNTIRRDAKVTVLDRELNKLDLIVEPETVSVVIPIKNPSKNIPIKLNTIGTASEDIEIQSVTSKTTEVIAFGRTETLQLLEEIQVDVDISNIKEDTEVEIPIVYPDGINNMSHDKIKVKIIAIQKIDEIVLNGIPIESRGLGNNLDLAILPPNTNTISIKVSGAKADINQVSAEQFQVFFNVDDLEAGEHEVELQAQGPDNIDWELAMKKVKILLNIKENV